MSDEDERPRTHYPDSDWTLPRFANILDTKHGGLPPRIDALRTAAIIAATGAMLTYFRIAVRDNDLIPPAYAAKALSGRDGKIRAWTSQRDQLISIHVTTGTVTQSVEPHDWKNTVLMVAAAWIASVINTDRTIMLVIRGYRYQINDGQICIQEEPTPS